MNIDKSNKRNGDQDYDYWNVGLWLANDEGLYNLVQGACRRSKTLNEAARMVLRSLHDAGIYETPDGAVYTTSRIQSAIEEDFTQK